MASMSAAMMVLIDLLTNYLNLEEYCKDYNEGQIRRLIHCVSYSYNKATSYIPMMSTA